jgi:hypothetical protein
MRLTGAVYANFLNTELAHLLENIPLIFLVNQWFQHDGAPPHFSQFFFLCVLVVFRFVIICFRSIKLDSF